MREQRKVENFMQEHGMQGALEFRILDLLAEVGDALFSLLAVCNSLDIDAEEALETSLEKYRQRIEETGDAGSR